MTYTYAGRYEEAAFTSDGGLLKGGAIAVYLPSTTTLATLYADRTKSTTAANPVTSDAVSGVLGFWADPGLYDLAGPGLTVSGVAVVPDAAEFQDANQRDTASGYPGLDPSKRLVSGAPAVTAAAGAAAGTSPPAPVVGPSNDQSGTVTFGSGSGSPAAGAQVIVSFSTAWASAPRAVIISPNNDATQQLGLFAGRPSTTGFTVSAHTAPAASQAAGTFSFSYLVL
ncbi:hypothetical protein [Frankia sp. AvcI1]|uniref:hypothetical protein n=1 Tax=Frankia sp. AvcI1 TaxID=573496 RepID=UPI002119470F|nr:hypothetical protein [Frankia sp. AvcI1]